MPNIIRGTQRKTTTQKRGRNPKLTTRLLRLFWRYCFEALYVVVAKFAAETKISVREITGLRYMQNVKMNCFVTEQMGFDEEGST